MITTLHETKFFTRHRVSLSEISFLGDSLLRSARLPSVGFCREMGFFYVFQDLQEALIRHLDIKPGQPKQQELFVLTLKEDVFFGAFSREYNGKEEVVPWWIIKPILRWQQLGIEKSIIPACGATFFMEAHIAEHQKQPVGVFLSLNCSSLYSEWYLRPTEITAKTSFRKGDVFLSVS